MAQLVTLRQFDAEKRHYHIYRIRSTALDHQEHYHNYYQVCYVVSGELHHRQGAETVKLMAGDAFIVPPGFVHSLHFNNAYTEMYSLSFEDSLFSPGFPQSNAYRFLTELQTHPEDGNTGALRLRIALNKAQQTMTESLLSCLMLQQQTPCQQGLSCASSITAALLCLLSQSYYGQPHNADRYESKTEYGGAIMACIDYIDHHYKESLNATDLSKRFGISRSVLFAVFPQFAGMPLRQYIASKRIKEAQMLIRAHPGRMLSQIATDVGYEDDSTFYRNFLKIAGVSPAKYRSVTQSNAAQE